MRSELLRALKVDMLTFINDNNESNSMRATYGILVLKSFNSKSNHMYLSVFHC